MNTCVGMSLNINIEHQDWETLLQPETKLEHALLADPDFVRGLAWGTPRYGHPEGEVYKHIAEVLRNVDRLAIDAQQRHDLRIIAFAHDTFKYAEDKGSPRDWTRHHGALARRFMEKYLDDTTLLNIIEWHDEAYYVWRLLHLHHQPEEAANRLDRLLDGLGNSLQLYYLFFKCDTRTGDKTLAPLRWFEQSIPDITILEL